MRCRVPAVLASLALLAALASGCGSREPELLPVPSGLPNSTAVPLVLLRAPGYTIKLPSSAQPYQQHYISHGQPATVGGYKASDLAGGNFLISRAPNPGTTPMNLDGLVAASVSAIGGTLKSSRSVAFHGHPAREIRYTANLAGADLTFFVVAIDFDNNLLQLQYAVPQKDLATKPPLFDEVLDTLKPR